MRKIVFVFCFVILSFVGHSQVILEHVYDTVTYDNWSNINGLFYPVKLSGSEVKYAEVDDGMIILYNLNHTIFKSITIPLVLINDNERIDFISTTLFDTDSSNIEYMVEGSEGPGFYGVYIFREDGTQLFFINDQYISPAVTSIGLSKPFQTIFNTPQGTKMMLVRGNGTIKVFSLPGFYYEYNALEEFAQSFNIELSIPFPNPAGREITIPYNIPLNAVNPALVLYSENGVEIMQIELNPNNGEILLNIETFSSGIYFVQVKAENGVSKGRKFIID